MKTTETIAAISTAYGNAAIGVIRISGNHVQNIITKYIVGNLLPRLATNTSIKDNGGKVIDSVIAIFYENPKLVSGCLLTWQDKILLCKRATEPRLGYWTLPAVFLENNETV